MGTKTKEASQAGTLHFVVECYLTRSASITAPLTYPPNIMSLGTSAFWAKWPANPPNSKCWLAQGSGVCVLPRRRVPPKVPPKVPPAAHVRAAPTPPSQRAHPRQPCQPAPLQRAHLPSPAPYCTSPATQITPTQQSSSIPPKGNSAAAAAAAASPPTHPSTPIRPAQVQAHKTGLGSYHSGRYLTHACPPRTPTSTPQACTRPSPPGVICASLAPDHPPDLSRIFPSHFSPSQLLLSVRVLQGDNFLLANPAVFRPQARRQARISVCLMNWRLG